MASDAEPTMDFVLRKLVAEVEADPHQIDVTLYLPWGAATGRLVPSIEFAQDFRGHLVEHDALDIADRFLSFEPEECDGNAAVVYAYLGKGSSTVIAGRAVEHGAVLRIRLADVSAWAPGLVTPRK